MSLWTDKPYNIDRIRAFVVQTAAEWDAKKKTRAKRRSGTWSHVLDRERSSSGPDPPS